jgi:ABC-type arginine/histidine transport system permease subunit
MELIVAFYLSLNLEDLDLLQGRLDKGLVSCYLYFVPTILHIQIFILYVCIIILYLNSGTCSVWVTGKDRTPFKKDRALFRDLGKGGHCDMEGRLN